VNRRQVFSRKRTGRTRRFGTVVST
jgi:hypothetical protein